MRKAFGLLVALVFVGALAVQSSSAHSRGHGDNNKDVLTFDSMAGVVEPVHRADRLRDLADRRVVRGDRLLGPGPLAGRCSRAARRPAQ